MTPPHSPLSVDSITPDERSSSSADRARPSPQDGPETNAPNTEAPGAQRPSAPASEDGGRAAEGLDVPRQDSVAATPTSTLVEERAATSTPMAPASETIAPPATPVESAPSPSPHVQPGRLYLATRTLPQPVDDPRPWYLFVAIDQATRWLFVRVTHELSPAATRAFLKTLLKTCPILVRELITITPSDQSDGGAMLPDTEALAQLCESLDIAHHQETAEPVSATTLLHGFDTLLEARLDGAEERLEAQPLKRALRQAARDYNHHQPQPILGAHTPIEALGKWYAESPDYFVAHQQRLSASTLAHTEHTRAEDHDAPPSRPPDTPASNTPAPDNTQALDPLQLARTLNRNTAASCLIRLRQQPPLGSLLVSSCNDGAGKTTVTLQLAYAGVQDIGLRVLLVDANPTHPHLASLFETDEGPGLCEFCAGRAQTDEVIRPTDTPGLDLVTLGLHQRDMLVRQDPQRLRARLDALRGAGAERYDLLLIDGPSSLGEQDLTIGATAFDGVILVIESERTRWEVMQYTQDRLQSAGARLLGAVLNKRKYYIPRGLYA